MPGDRVLALDAGEVVDFDSPSALLHITKPEEAPIAHPKSGALVELVGRSGPEEEYELRCMAAAGFVRRLLLVRHRAKKAIAAKRSVVASKPTTPKAALSEAIRKKPTPGPLEVFFI